MTRIYDDSIKLGFTADEREKVLALLEWWFPALKYSEEEMNGTDTVDELVELHAWAGGVQVEGEMEVPELIREEEEGKL